MEIPFVGGAYLGRSSNLNAQVCQNLYPILGGPGGKKIVALANTPGLTEWVDLGTGEIRGLDVMGDYLYATHGNSIKRIDSSASVTTMTGTLAGTTGKVWMKNNGTQLMIVDNPYGYILEGTSFALVSDGDFPTASSLAFQDGYFIISKGGSGQFWISALYDGNDWDPLDYATAEGDPDYLQCVISARRELWLLGTQSYEVWYNSGDADFPFERIQGSFNRIGCISRDSASEIDGVVVWLDNMRRVRASDGYNAVKITTEQIDYQFDQYTEVTDALGFCYSQEGHSFYVLTFPTENKTWVYDFTTQLWHTRASGATDIRHRANCYANFKGMHIVGDYTNGKLYKYELNNYTDDNAMLRRIRTAQVISVDKKICTHSSLEVDMESGVGLTVDHPVLGRGQNPEAILDWSNDGGHTWSNEHNAYIGAIGKYKTRVRWNKLGSARDRIYRLKITDPVKTVILGAHLEMEVGSS